MKTALMSYAHQPLQSLFNVALAIIVLAIPSASLSDMEYYKILITGYFTNFFSNKFFNGKSL